jgi:hypothetical protein
MLTANFATYYDALKQVYPRKTQTLQMLQSIKGQFDVVRCWFNGVQTRPEWLPDWVEVHYEFENDLTDLGKFAMLKPGMEEIYFTLDDDIAYPPTYAVDMVEAIKQHGCVVTHHGRKLVGKKTTYYKGHAGIHCLQYNANVMVLDVPGTGVMAFDTNYFNPYWLKYSTDRLMSDLTFAVECAKHGVRIMGLPHGGNYFRYLEPELTGTTIHQRMCNNEVELVKRANQIWDLKNK